MEERAGVRRCVFIGFPSSFLSPLVPRGERMESLRQPWEGGHRSALDFRMKIAENKAELNSKPPKNRAALGRASKPGPGRLTRLALVAGCALPVPARAGESSFRNDVLAVISKAGCNAGTGHGHRARKAGFKTSLRGEESELD